MELMRNTAVIRGALRPLCRSRHKDGRKVSADTRGGFHFAKPGMGGARRKIPEKPAKKPPTCQNG